ncbi:MAG: acyl-CoA thioesterase [Acidimicrobiales bacterium]
MSGEWSFESDTMLERIDDGVWTSEISDSWNIGVNPNGGYLSAFVLRAMKEVSDHQDPVSMTTHYLRPGSAGEPCQVRVDVVRRGRSLTTLRGSLVQDGRPRLEMLAALADLSAPATGDTELSVSPPTMPPPEECVTRSGSDQGVELPISQRIETRLHPDYGRGGQAGAPEMLGWIRFTDDRPPDTAATALFADAFPPSLFGLLGFIGWVPTIELTVHIRRRPSPGWMLGSFQTNDLHHSRMIESGMLWDSGGQLVAQARQLGMLLVR